MEFLKELFDGKPLTYEQLAEAAKGKGLSVVNAAGGAYVSKSEADSLTAQLAEANKKLEGYDPEWKTKAEAAQAKLDAERLEDAILRGVTGAKAKNAKAVLALIDREKLKYAGGEVIGLDKQLSELKKGEDTAFLFEQETPVKTGMSHQGAGEGGNSKKDAANNALRALFGH